MTALQLDRFTPQVEESISAASRQASDQGHSVIGADNLLFGLLFTKPAEPTSAIARIMERRFKVTRYRVFSAIKELSVTDLYDTPVGETYTRGAQRALAFAEGKVEDGPVGRYDVMAGLASCEDNNLLLVLAMLDVDPKELARVMNDPNNSENGRV